MPRKIMLDVRSVQYIPYIYHRRHRKEIFFRPGLWSFWGGYFWCIGDYPLLWFYGTLVPSSKRCVLKFISSCLSIYLFVRGQPYRKEETKTITNQLKVFVLNDDTRFNTSNNAQKSASLKAQNPLALLLKIPPKLLFSVLTIVQNIGVNNSVFDGKIIQCCFSKHFPHSLWTFPCSKTQWNHSLSPSIHSKFCVLSPRKIVSECIFIIRILYYLYIIRIHYCILFCFAILSSHFTLAPSFERKTAVEIKIHMFGKDRGHPTVFSYLTVLSSYCFLRYATVH